MITTVLCVWMVKYIWKKLPTKKPPSVNIAYVTDNIGLPSYEATVAEQGAHGMQYVYLAFALH